MSTLKVNNLQVGQDGTAANNYTLYQPIVPDGTVRLGYGVAGSVTDILTLKNSRLGIGTNDPQEDLHIASNSPYILLDDLDNFRKWRLKGTAWFAIEDTTAGEDRLRILSDGKVAIGGVTANSLLDVHGGDGISITHSGDTFLQSRTTGTTGTNYLEFKDAGGASGAISYHHNGNSLRFKVDGSERARIDSDGWLGLNETSKANAGQVAAFKNTTYTHSWLNINVNNNTGVSGVVFGDSDLWSPGYIQYRHSTDDMEIITNSLERLRITSAGRFGFNNSSPSVSIDLSNNTDAVALPTGTTAQRPSGTDAYIRKNSTNNALEFYNGIEWVEIITDYFPTGSTILG